MKKVMYFVGVVIFYLLINTATIDASTNVENSLPMQKDWSVIAQEAKNVVVKIEMPDSMGSGFFVNDGIIITNYHVVKNAPIKAIPVGDRYEDAGIVTITPYQDNQVVKRYLGTIFPSLCFPEYDIAFVIVGDKGKILQFNESPEVGKPVLVIGSPEEFEFSLTSGIISAYRQDANGIIYIQTDAAVNQGNIGGPLIDSYGRIVGIATSKLASDEVDNIAFAISIRSVMDILNINNLSSLIKSVQNADIEKLPSKASNSDIAKKVDVEAKKELHSTNKVESEASPKEESANFKIFYIICSIAIIGYLAKKVLKLNK